MLHVGPFVSHCFARYLYISSFVTVIYLIFIRALFLTGWKLPKCCITDLPEGLRDSDIPKRKIQTILATVLVLSDFQNMTVQGLKMISIWNQFMVFRCFQVSYGERHQKTSQGQGLNRSLIGLELKISHWLKISLKYSGLGLWKKSKRSTSANLLFQGNISFSVI